MKRFLSIILCLLLLSGCAAQRYEMPAQDVLNQSQIIETMGSSGMKD